MKKQLRLCFNKQQLHSSEVFLMKIKWLLHSCFLMTSQEGTHVLTDPYDTRTGLTMPEVSADIVTTSHGHGDHNFVKAVSGSFTLLDKPGSFKVKDIVINGFSTFHDNEGGTKRGNNIVFMFEIDGVRICHCGDLGHLPSAELVEKLGRVDVLMLPVGSVYTINAAEAAETVRLVKPSIAIPMHFKLPSLAFGLDGVDKFLAAAGGSKAGRNEIEVTKETLGGPTRIEALM